MDFQLGGLQHASRLAVCIDIFSNSRLLAHVDQGPHQGLAAGGGGGALRFHAASIGKLRQLNNIQKQR